MPYLYGTMNNPLNISILGTGNVARHLALRFFQAGIPVNMVYGRSASKASELAQMVGALSSDSIKMIPRESNILFLCVSDDAIEELAGEIPNPEITVVHTSGSVPLSLLLAYHRNAGVFYPFQSLSSEVDQGQVSLPVSLEASNEAVMEQLLFLARKITDKIVTLNSTERMHLHLAGVMANNFSNHLFARVFDFLEQHNLDSGLLHPLLEETFRKIKAHHPRDMQTGPARRGDVKIVKKHIDLLTGNHELQKIYSLLSNSITDYYSRMPL